MNYTPEEVNAGLRDPVTRQHFKEGRRFAASRQKKIAKMRDRVAQLFETIKACQLCGLALILKPGARNQALLLGDDGLQCNRCRSGATKAAAEKAIQERPAIVNPGFYFSLNSASEKARRIHGDREKKTAVTTGFGPAFAKQIAELVEIDPHCKFCGYAVTRGTASISPFGFLSCADCRRRGIGNGGAAPEPTAGADVSDVA
jgi:hypothetical protein